MNAKLAKFIKETTPRKRASKLSKYKEEIKELLKLKYTHQQIVEYLSTAHNIEISRQYLSSWIKKSLDSKAPPTSQVKPVKSQSDAVAKMQKMFTKEGSNA